jgi:hypothetical protein
VLVRVDETRVHFITLNGTYARRPTQTVRVRLCKNPALLIHPELNLTACWAQVENVAESEVGVPID